MTSAVPDPSSRQELELLVTGKVKLPPYLIRQMTVIWWTAYSTSLKEELPDEVFSEFLERYLYRTESCLYRWYPEGSLAQRTKSFEAKCLRKVLETIFNMEIEEEEDLGPLPGRMGA